MNLRLAFAVSAALTLMLFAALDASAADRELWKHSQGYFVKLRGNNCQERGTKDEGKFNYVESKRTDEFVELFDKSRKVTVRLRKGPARTKTRRRRSSRSSTTGSGRTEPSAGASGAGDEHRAVTGSPERDLRTPRADAGRSIGGCGRRRNTSARRPGNAR